MCLFVSGQDYAKTRKKRCDFDVFQDFCFGGVVDKLGVVGGTRFQVGMTVDIVLYYVCT